MGVERTVEDYIPYEPVLSVSHEKGVERKYSPTYKVLIKTVPYGVGVKEGGSEFPLEWVLNAFMLH
jgi:hypothetical protein